MELYYIFIKLSSKNNLFYVLGELNIKLMQTNNKFVKRYFNIVLSSSCKCAIGLPTHFTKNSKTLLDHIYVNENKHFCMSGVILNNLSNHFGIFISISTKKLNKTKLDQLIIRGMGNFSYEMLLKEFKSRLQVENFAESESMKKQLTPSMRFSRNY